MTDYYTMIPNILFYTKKDDNNKSIFQQISDTDKFNCKDYKVILVMDYLWTNTNRKGDIRFTIDDLVTYCGFEPNPRKDRTNSQFIKILESLSACKVIELKVNNTIYVCTIKIDINKGYIRLFENVKNKILQYHDKDNIDNIKLLMYYCYLDARIFKRGKDDDLQKFGGRSEIAFINYDTISDDLFLTDKTIKKYNDILINLDLIRVGNAGKWYYTDDHNHLTKESPNFYCLFNGDENDSKLQIKEGIKYYQGLDRNSNKTFVNNRKYKNMDKHTIGKYGSLMKKLYQGNITDDDNKELQKIIQFREANENQFNVKALLKKYPNNILSMIYSSYANEDKADEIYNLEIELGLIDDNQNLLVDKKYYDHIMTNYKENDKQKYINYVNAYKNNSNSNIIKVQKDRDILAVVGEPNPFATDEQDLY